MSGALHSPTYDRFRGLITQARKDAGLTQAELSERVGRPQSFVSKYECGERRLDVIEFLQVCKALKINSQSIIREIVKGGLE
jgi:transcriptional regulator with XRE-family HTH domain